MDEKILRLLKNPVSKWTKSDTIIAARLLSNELLLHPSKGIIHRAMVGIPQYEDIRIIATKLFDTTAADVNFVPSRPGRKKGSGKFTNESAIAFLKAVEKRRKRLASEGNVTIKKITDKAVADDFGNSKGMENFRKKYGYSKLELAYKTQQKIKYMKQIIKSG